MSEDNVEIKKPICIGLDVGTMNLVCTRSDTNETKITRNVFLPVSKDEIGMSDLSELSHIVNSDGDMFIIGEDAFKFSNIFGQEVRRPMKRGVISSEEIDAVEILTLIIKDLIGDLNGQQAYCTYSIPAEVLDSEKSITYHEKIFGRILSSLGINATPLNEAMSIIYAECQSVGFSGIGISAGAGMVNCLEENTIIPLLNGDKKTMKQLSEDYPNGEEFWVYSRDENGNIVPGKAHHPMKTKSVGEIYKITLDNDEYFECTGDHKILLKSNEYCEAKNLSIDDSLSPLYLRNGVPSNRNYMMVYNNNKWEFVHRLVSRNIVGQIEENMIVHHIDENTMNNNPTNLKQLTLNEHLAIHRLYPEEHAERTTGKTYDELYGKDKANDIKQKLSKSYKKNIDINHMTYQAGTDALKQRHDFIKNKSYEEIYGIKGANKIKQKMSAMKKNKTFEEIMIDKDNVYERKEALRTKALTQIENNDGFAKYERTPEHLEKIKNSLFKEGQIPWNKGKFLSKEQKQKISENSKKQSNDPIKKRKMMIGTGIKIAKIILARNLTINEENFEIVREEMRKPRWKPISYEKWMNWIPANTDILNMVRNWNHKINKIEIINKQCDVYDMTVDKHHNFGLDCGIFVHNCTVSYKGVGVIEFSTDQSGDWIDKNVADSLNMIPNRVTNIKEKYLGLDSDFREHKNKKIRRVLEALQYYYSAMAENTVKRILKEFELKVDLDLDEEIPIVIAGGTSMPKGFIKLFQSEFDKYDTPFEVSEIRHASDPMTTVSNGLLIKSLASVPK